MLHNFRKSINQIIGMTNSFKKWRTKAEATGQSINPHGHDQPVNDELSKNGTVCQLLVLKCPQYYDFEDLFHDHPNITAPGLVESEAPDHERGYEVPMDRNDNKEADTANVGEDDIVNSPILWPESDPGMNVNFVFISCILTY